MAIVFSVTLREGSTPRAPNPPLQRLRRATGIVIMDRASFTTEDYESFGEHGVMCRILDYLRYETPPQSWGGFRKPPPPADVYHIPLEHKVLA